MAKNIADVLGVSCDELLGEPKGSSGRTSEKALVCMALALVLLAATLFVVVCTDKGKGPDSVADASSFHIVGQNYARDAEEGKVYELSIVYDGVPGEEDIFTYMSEISEDYREGRFGDLETSVIKCIFYDSEDAAEKGENTWIVSFLHL